MEPTDVIELSTYWNGAQQSAKETRIRMTDCFLFLIGEGRRWERPRGGDIRLTQLRTFTLPNGQTASYVWFPLSSQYYPLYGFQLDRLGADAFFREVVESELVRLLEGKERRKSRNNWTELVGHHRFFLVEDGTETTSERIAYDRNYHHLQARTTLVWKGYNIPLVCILAQPSHLRAHPRIRKEELVQSVFHPERLFRCLELYGDDWVERVTGDSG